ncbi:hypothetical protein [Corynebacterium lubricantis]|uniref:hypothetical protein n=1 Tax=Corynebacterium lubricantis TaxID=541095 RepID=UPI00035D7B8D|nr:hypothetical protein [Corynebacterium lubricantis]
MTKKPQATGTQLPATVKWAAIISLVQMVAAFIYAGLQIYWEASGTQHSSLESASQNTQYVGYGTAIFIILVFGAMGAAAYSMLSGKVWGRGLIVLMQFILLGVAYFMFSGGAILLAIATGLSALVALVMLFNPRSTEWVASRYGA